MRTVKPIFYKVRFSALWRQICTELLLEIVDVLRKSLEVKLYLFYTIRRSLNSSDTANGSGRARLEGKGIVYP